MIPCCEKCRKPNACPEGLMNCLTLHSRCGDKECSCHSPGTYEVSADHDVLMDSVELEKWGKRKQAEILENVIDYLKKDLGDGGKNYWGLTEVITWLEAMKKELE